MVSLVEETCDAALEVNWQWDELATERNLYNPQLRLPKYGTFNNV